MRRFYRYFRNGGATAGLTLGEFLKQHPECRDTLVNLLVGNVFRIDDSDMFAKMSGMVELPEPRRLASEAEVPS